MAIDHSLNLKLLDALEKEFPDTVDISKLNALGEQQEVKRSLYYLSEQGYVDINESKHMRGSDLMSAKITASGIDKIGD
jgi:transcription initiation factor IIE alpha subunit